MQIVPHLHNWRKNLSEDAKISLDKASTRHKYNKGQIIYSLDEESTCGFQIVSGSVKVCVYSEDGHELVLANFYSGDCIGDIGLMTKAPRANYAIAREDCVISVLSAELFRAICKKHPEILESINLLLCFRLQMNAELLEDAYFLSLYDRLAKVITRLAFSREANNGSITIKDISQETLGFMTGATRQSVARELKNMELEGILSYRYNTITIPNVNKLIEKYKQSAPSTHIIASYN